jgi:hypothetical protein
MEVLNFVVLGKCVWHHCSNCCFDIGVWWKPKFSSSVTVNAMCYKFSWVKGGGMKSRRFGKILHAGLQI